MAKKGKGKAPKAPPGPGYVSDVQAPAKRTGKGPSVPKVKFRKPMAPPTKVERDKRMKKTLRAIEALNKLHKMNDDINQRANTIIEMLEQVERDIAEGRTKPMFDDKGNWAVDDDDGEY